MSSYYNTIAGTLKTGQTARASDINLIQSSIQDAFQRALIDICGVGVVLGEEEEALKLYPTTDHIDQSNYSDDENHTISFGDIYLRQPIDIEKSSIETIRVYMLNYSNLNVTVYGEIRNADLNLVAETNAILPPTEENDFAAIDFNFNEDHLALGKYYFVLRPVDVSTIDLVQNGDEDTIYDNVAPEMFRIKYDNTGQYTNADKDIENTTFANNVIGLEASYDGNEYLKAVYLQETIDPDDDINYETEKNFDLCFEHIFSSGNTYLINNGAAIILGEKVYPLDTHISIDGPNTDGDRTDLVILTQEGQLRVIKGTPYNGEKIYPIDNTGLKIAYITSYKSTSNKNNKVPAIEQSDENDITRQRDILERLRRLEKKMNYQFSNNAPTRIKYNCTVDPILVNNSGTDDGEGTYGISQGTATDGSDALTVGKSQTYSWSIIDNNYSYNYTSTSKVTGTLKIYDVHMPVTKPSNIQSYMKCQISVTAPGYGSKGGVGGVPYAKLQVTIKKNSNTVHTYNIKTDNKGLYNLSLWNIKKLKTGKYKIYVKYGTQSALKANMTVYKSGHSFSNIKPKSYTKSITIQTATPAQATHTIPSGIFTGDDSFYKDKIDVNTDNGTVSVQRIGDTGEYSKNKLLKDKKVFSSADTVYKLKNENYKLTSEYPVLNFTLSSDTYIKSITPYISGFKNLDKFGILIFKNDFVFSNVKNTRKVIQKKVSKSDPIFPTEYDSGWKSLKNLSKQKDGYRKPKTQTKFTINKDFKAGTYSLVIYGHIESSHKEGAIKMTEYVTRDYKKEYGIATKCIGGAKLSVLNMDTSNLTNKSWDLLIEQKPYKYYDSGTLISKAIITQENITACSCSTKKRNFKIPNGCSINLYVSNNGGTSWVNANSGYVKFDGDGYSFRWKLEMTTNSTQTPKLVYNEAWKYAISFNLKESKTYTPYEDYQQCYETPLLNANAITRTFVANNQIQHRFSEWEFARIYMEEDEDNSDIDILFSYADDNYSTVATPKESWGKDIFFSQIFASLKLSDFSRESVDYDNYDGNVEYDEYNYPFKLESDNIIHNTGGYALASPDVYYKQTITSPYIYGDIGKYNENSESTDMYQNFDYYPDNIPYTYTNNTESEDKYAGMHVVDGPICKAIQKTEAPSYTSDDIIVGISFNNSLEIDENITHFNIGVKIVQDEESNTTTENNDTTSTNNISFEPGTFEIVLAVNKYGEIDNDDATNGKAYPINETLVLNEYTEITVNFIEDLNGFMASGIGSIGIRAVDPENTFTKNVGIGIGRVSTLSYNIRPYVPYMYHGEWDRFSWQTISNRYNSKNEKPQAYAIYKYNKTDNYYGFYPITNYDKDAYTSVIQFAPSNNEDNLPITITYKDIDDNTITLHEGENILGTEITLTDSILNTGNALHTWRTSGTLKTHYQTHNNAVIRRNGHEIQTSPNSSLTHKTKDSGNDILFYLPENITGVLFGIETNIPYTIYDLIEIEYYVLCTSEGGELKPHGFFSKGDIYINFYDTTLLESEPVESFALPAWGKIQEESTVSDKTVHSWFKKRSNSNRIKMITLERKNPREQEGITPGDLYLVIKDIKLFNAETEAALGPQMQIRIYPNNKDNTSNTTIRKVGGIYRI